MSDYYATLKVQQGRLKTGMIEMGIRTVAELSRRARVSQSEIGKLLNFKKSPRCDSGEWRKSVLSVCKILGFDPNEMFPTHLQHEIVTNCISKFFDRRQLTGSDVCETGPAEQAGNDDAEEVVGKVLDTLPIRDRRILRARFWEGRSLSDVAKDEGCGRANILRLERRALGRLRCPIRAAKLLEVFDEA